MTDISIELIESTMPALKRKEDQPNRRQFHNILSSYRMLLEQTLTIYQWLYKDKHDVVHMKPIQRGSLISLSHEPINNYLQLFQTVLNDQHGGYPTGFSCQFPKFHLLQHYPIYIARFGSPKNYNGAPSERNHKHLKGHARKTQKRSDTLSFQTASNYSNQKILSRAFQYHNSQFEVQDNVNSNDNTNHSSNSAKFEIKYDSTLKQCTLQWNSSVPPYREYDNDMLSTIAHWLWENRTVHLSDDISVPGFTDLSYKNNTFRAHPSYRSNKSWFDWANFKWEGYDDGVPGRIFMFIDLRYVPDNPLGNDIFAIIQSAESIATSIQNDRAKDLKLCTFWKMEPKYRAISVNCISSPTYVINNFDNTKDINVNDDMQLLKSVIQIKSFSEWKYCHL